MIDAAGVFLLLCIVVGVVGGGAVLIREWRK